MNVFIIILGILFTFSNISATDEKPILCNPVKGDSDQNQYSPDFLFSLGIDSQVKANHLDKIDLYKKNAFHRKALQYFQTYISCAKENNLPISSTTYFLLASSHFELQEYTDSLIGIELALSNSKDIYKDALLLKTRVLIKQNKYIQATDLLENVVTSLSNDSDVLYFLGSLNAKIGNYPKAILYLTVLYHSIENGGDPRYRPNVLQYLGEIYSKKGDAVKSLYYLKLLIKNNKQDPEILFTIAQTLITIGEFNESRVYLNKILKINPSSIAVIQLLGEMQFIENKMFSLTYFEKLKQEGKIRENSLLGAIYKVLVGRHKETEEYFIRMSEKNPNRLSLRIGLIIIYSKLKKTNELANELKATAEIAYSYKQYNLAIELAMQLLELSLTNPEIRIRPVIIYDFIAKCYEDNGSPFIAIHYLKRALDISENKEDHTNLTIHLARTYRNEKVKRYTKSTQMLNPIAKTGNPNAFFMIGLNYTSLEKYKESITAFTKAIELNPKNPIYYFFRASSYEKEKKIKETIYDLKKSIELDNTNAATYNFIGYLYIENNMDLTEAFEYIKNAIELESDNSTYQDSLGWVLYKMAKYKDSLYHLNLAIQMMIDKKENDPVVYDHLGDVYLILNDRENANENWKKSIELQSNPEDKEKVLLKLKRIVGQIQVGK